MLLVLFNNKEHQYWEIYVNAITSSSMLCVNSHKLLQLPAVLGYSCNIQVYHVKSVLMMHHQVSALPSSSHDTATT